MLMPTHNPLPMPIEAERVTDAPRNVPTGPSFQVIEETTWAVSYTHLTLPTIYSV